jgi:hypothetical protein
LLAGVDVIRYVERSPALGRVKTDGAEGLDAQPMTIMIVIMIMILYSSTGKLPTLFFSRPTADVDVEFACFPLVILLST